MTSSVRAEGWLVF